MKLEISNVQQFVLHNEQKKMGQEGENIYTLCAWD